MLGLDRVIKPKDRPLVGDESSNPSLQDTLGRTHRVDSHEDFIPVYPCHCNFQLNSLQEKRKADLDELHLDTQLLNLVAQ